MIAGSSSPCPADDVVIDSSTGTVFAAVHDYGVFVSTNSGNTWSAATLPGITNGSVGRIGLAAADGVAYAMVGSSAGSSYLGLFRYSGSTWLSVKVPCQLLTAPKLVVYIDGTADTSGSCLNPSAFSQSDFDQTLTIQPGTHGSGVVFGGVGLYYSADSANTWTFLSVSVYSSPV